MSTCKKCLDKDKALILAFEALALCRAELGPLRVVFNEAVKYVKSGEDDFSGTVAALSSVYRGKNSG